MNILEHFKKVIKRYLAEMVLAETEHLRTLTDAFENDLELLKTNKCSPSFVYGLLDPHNNSVFYVGQTNNLQQRFKEYTIALQTKKIKPYKKLV